MRMLAWLGLPIAVVLLLAWVVIRRRQRLPDVSPDWMRDQAYDKTGGGY